MEMTVKELSAIVPYKSFPLILPRGTNLNKTLKKPINFLEILECNGLENTLLLLENAWKSNSKNIISKAWFILELFAVGVAYECVHFFESEFFNDPCLRNFIKARHLHAYKEIDKKEYKSIHCATEKTIRGAMFYAHYDCSFSSKATYWAACVAAQFSPSWSAHVGNYRFVSKQFQYNLLKRILEEN